jgi:hypothetical protein
MTTKTIDNYPSKRTYSINEGKAYLNLNNCVRSYYRDFTSNTDSKIIYKTIARMRIAAKQKLYNFKDKKSGLTLVIADGNSKITDVQKDYLPSRLRGYKVNGGDIQKSLKTAIENALTGYETDESRKAYWRVYGNLILQKKYDYFDESTQLEVNVLNLESYEKGYNLKD